MAAMDYCNSDRTDTVVFFRSEDHFRYGVYTLSRILLCNNGYHTSDSEDQTSERDKNEEVLGQIRSKWTYSFDCGIGNHHRGSNQCKGDP